MNRRALFGAAPAIALVAAAPAAIAAATHQDDRELIDLARQWHEIARQLTWIDEEEERLCARLAAMALPMPEALRYREGDCYGRILPHKGGYFNEADVRAWDQSRKVYHFGSDDYRARVLKRANEIVEAWDAYQQQRRQQRIDVGLTDLEERRRALLAEQDAVERRTFGLRARDPEAVLFKAQLVYRYHCEDEDDFGSFVITSLLADVAPDYAGASRTPATSTDS